MMQAQTNHAEEYRLSSQQSRTHLDTDAAAGQPPVVALVLQGPASDCDAQALRAALRREAARHEVLRTRYRTIEDVRYPVQQVLQSMEPAWHEAPASASDDELLRQAQSLVDAQAGPVLAAVVAQDGPRIRWALATSRMGLDVASLQMLALACLQSPAAGEASEPPLQYADYTAWQDELLASELGQDGAHFWQTRLQPQESPPRLPFARQPFASQSAAAPARVQSPLPPAGVLAPLVSLGAATVHSAVLSAWLAYMARLCRSDRICFTWAADQRSAEIEQALGNYEAVLPMVARLDESRSVREGLAAIEAQLGECREWAECLDARRLHEHMGARDKAFSRLVYQHVRLLDLPAGWSWRAWDVPTPQAWLACQCVEQEGQLAMRWSSHGSLAPEALQAFARQFNACLEAAARDGQSAWRELPLLCEAQRQEIAQFSGAGLAGGHAADGAPAQGLHALFEAAARLHSDRTAVAGADGSLGYAELDRRASALAQELAQAGLGRQAIVGVVIGRSIHAITAMLAVLKAGAAYVPIDPDYPRERVEYVLRDSGVQALVALAGDATALASSGLPVFAADLARAQGAAAPGRSVHGQELAYVIYTSGSTGQPKGVMVSHGNAVASTQARMRFYGEPVGHFLLLSSFSFDSSVAGIFWTLAQGGTLHIPHQDEHNLPDLLGRRIAQLSISHLLALPALYQHILEHAPECGALRCAIVAGEACQADVVARHRQRAGHAQLVNEYGPTEGTVWSNAFRIGPSHVAQGGIPIGRPIPGARAWVLDHRLQPCAVGSVGELYVGGPGVTRGYLNRPALTAQRFVADPLGSGQRLYRTGDLARYRPDGEIDCLGRADGQVKLRGHRIELGEIEDCLARHPGVREAVALLREDAQTGARIVACVTAVESDGHDRLREAVLAHARQLLPAVMLPSAIAVAQDIPRLPNGKVDRAALGARLDEAARRPAHVEPLSEVEKTLAHIWQAVLKVDRVGLDDDFFELGGHSLLATQVVARVRQQLAVDLPVKDVFTASRLRELAARVGADAEALDRELALLEQISSDVDTQ